VKPAGGVRVPLPPDIVKTPGCKKTFVFSTLLGCKSKQLKVKSNERTTERFLMLMSILPFSG
jgi:hypothetical protein